MVDTTISMVNKKLVMFLLLHLLQEISVLVVVPVAVNLVMPLRVVELA